MSLNTRRNICYACYNIYTWLFDKKKYYLLFMKWEWKWE